MCIDQVGAIESVKAASDIYCPVSGEITDVNASLGDEPSLLNQSPEEDGKFFGGYLNWNQRVKLNNIQLSQVGWPRSS